MDILTFTLPETRWLSNMTRVQIEADGIIYNSTENYYQAMKYAEIETREYIAKLSPLDSKKYSRENRLTNPSFEINKINIMTKAQELKYQQEPFKTLLLNTVGILEEGNWWGDTFWGTDIETRDGLNNLGKILMNIRKRLKEDILL